jgi:sarcosine oxidase, subunit alpha
MSRAGPYRLSRGGQIDRARSVSFSFNGRRYAGFAGDTLASALLGTGVRTVARSFKFHRPRGVFACGMEEPSALLQLGDGPRTVPSERAPHVELTDGMQARSQLGWPSVDFDVGRSMDLVAPLWSAGFYNRTFMWPSWRIWEPVIRRMAGLGRSPTEPDPDRYEVSNLHCDVLVVGGGYAGLQSALCEGRAGARVVLVEQDREFGGELSWDDATTVESSPARTWVEHTLAQLRCLPDVRLFSRTTATGHYDHNVVTLLERMVSSRDSSAAPRERYWVVRAGRVILATGAIEQPLIFTNNDRPGIMLAGAARQYLRRYGVAVGGNVLIATNNDSAYALARDLRDAGVAVPVIADSRFHVADSIRAAMHARSIDVLPGCIPVDTSGFSALRAVTLGRLLQNGSGIDSQQTIACDALAVSGGFAPTLHLYAQARGKLAYDEASGALRPVSTVPGPAGIEIVGAAAEVVRIGPRVSPAGDPKRKWVDLLHDVTVADLELAQRENYTSVEHVKRFTTVGMAADQGKTSAAATLDTLGKLRGISPHDLGHTTLRPPFVPVTLGAIAGRAVGEHFAPTRRLPVHDWHVAHRALLQDFGEWQRPVVYQRDGESRAQAVAREALTVRSAAGIFDASSLGKIEIHGPDALDFLDRFYINDLTTLKPLRARYGLMLRESGVLFDDGTVVMLAPDRFVITTTSGNAGRVAQWLEEWHQCEWPHLRVAIVPVTDQWATISLAGPSSRAILSTLQTDIDLSTAAFPHLSMREGRLLGAPARVYRVSFTGELTYEINVPASKAQALWEALLANGVQPFGMDALMLMRLEKGFLHLGADTDGTTVPDDVGWGKVAASKKRDYIGKRSLSLPEHVKPDRLQLVGLIAVDRPARTSFVVGSHLRTRASTERTDGWITSAGTGVLTHEPIALAMLRGGRACIGAEVDVYDQGVLQTRARVVAPPFVDPAGDRMNA